MVIIKYFLILTLLTVLSGQLFRFGISQTASFTATDILTIATSALFIIFCLTLKKQFKVDTRVVTTVLIFTTIVLAVNTLALLRFTPQNVIVASLFLVRFLGIFFLSQVVLNTIEKSKQSNWINFTIFVGFLFALLGFVQLVIYPDLTPLTTFGWDPHQKRIVSSFLDPNYAGLAYTFFFSLSLSSLLFVKETRSKAAYYYFATTVIFFLAIILTFSRSSYLAVIAAIFIIGIHKSQKMLFFASVAFVIAIAAIPQMRQRVIGALQIDDTSQARIESWKQGFSVFMQNPIFGVGFNTYRYVQIENNVFTTENQFGGHSGGGVDSSMLLVAATTGIFGFTSFVVFLAATLNSIKTKAKTKAASLAAVASFFALLVHSQFVNSMFFPQTMLIFWVIVGLAKINDAKQKD